MYQVLNSLGPRILAPRGLFLAAAAFALGAFALGLAEYQDRANRDVALHQGPPPDVAVQDYKAAHHTGPTGEVMIRAEAGFDNAIVLSIPGVEPPQRALVAPLYPLSEMGQALIDARSDGTRTALTAQVARRTVDGSAPRPAAIGLLFHSLSPGTEPPGDPAALTIGAFGEGEHGQVVIVNGVAADPGAFGLMAAGAFAARGVELAGRSLSIQPYAHGREAALGASSGNRNYLLPAALALVLVLGGCISAIWGRRRARVAQWDDEVLAGLAPDEAAPKNAHPKFAPIPSQREIVEAANARASGEPSRAIYYALALLRGLWICLRRVASASVLFGQMLRNRLSRPEDEAL